ELRIVMLTMHENERYLYEALKSGACGYVVKAAADRDLVEACRAALRGERFVHPNAMTPLIKDFLERTDDNLPAPEEPLTPREQEVVKLVAEGYSSKEIAGTLVIS